jgi:restriction endonuclease S subunit
MKKSYHVKIGSVISRYQNEASETEIAVIAPAAITANGTFDAEVLMKSKIKVDEVFLKKQQEKQDSFLSQVDDIIIKLSPPFDNAVVTPEFAGCLVSSNCAIIRIENTSELDPRYLSAFLASSGPKKMLEESEHGLLKRIYTSNLNKIEIPLIHREYQEKIVEFYALKQKLNDFDLWQEIFSESSSIDPDIDAIFSDLYQDVLSLKTNIQRLKEKNHAQTQ